MVEFPRWLRVGRRENACSLILRAAFCDIHLLPLIHCQIFFSVSFLGIYTMANAPFSCSFLRLERNIQSLRCSTLTGLTMVNTHTLSLSLSLSQTNYTEKMHGMWIGYRCHGYSGCLPPLEKNMPHTQLVNSRTSMHGAVTSDLRDMHENGICRNLAHSCKRTRKLIQQYINVLASRYSVPAHRDIRKHAGWHGNEILLMARQRLIIIIPTMYHWMFSSQRLSQSAVIWVYRRLYRIWWKWPSNM